MDGVLVSWAVPKGIPESTEDKRLAVHVENHPLDYSGFEGTIPKGNYGAGEVAIWDRGTWAPLETAWKRRFKAGKLKFVLDGERLQGRFLLARMKDGPNWLLRRLEGAVPEELRSPGEVETPHFIEPQLARVVPAVPGGRGWSHELKFDGYRLQAVKHGNSVRMFTRNGHDWTDRFGKLARAIAALAKEDLVLDGEAVVFDGKGRSSFGALQQALQEGGESGIVFVVFDLLHRDGVSLRRLPLAERRRLLETVVKSDDEPVRLSGTWPDAEGAKLFREACKLGLEGIISKPLDATYREGSRREWTKSKCRGRQEFAIAGYTPPKGSRAGFGALWLASREHGRWISRGKVGTGFSEAERNRLLKRFKPLAGHAPWFDVREPGITWLKPGLVGEFEFAEITRDGSVRQGSYLGLREDKAATEVAFEGVVASSTSDKIKVKGIAISHPDRLVFPDDGITKGEVARHYAEVGKWMLPYVVHRPLAVLRAPSGIGGPTFFQKSFPNHIPPEVRQEFLDDGSEVFSIGSVEALVSLAQFGALEFHPWGARLDRPDAPDFLVWDLDPHPDVPWREVQGAALLLHDWLADRGLAPLLKTSGGKGLHVVLPVLRTETWDTMKAFSRAVAAEIAAYHPRRFLIKASKAARKGKIYIDWLRNGRGSTCVAPWCVRARPGAAISMPVPWDDLAAIPPQGFHLREPMLTPPEWLKPHHQRVRKELLQELGVH